MMSQDHTAGRPRSETKVHLTRLSLRPYILSPRMFTFFLLPLLAPNTLPWCSVPDPARYCWKGKNGVCFALWLGSPPSGVSL